MILLNGCKVFTVGEMLEFLQVLDQAMPIYIEERDEEMNERWDRPMRTMTVDLIRGHLDVALAEHTHITGVVLS